ncbi:MAG: HNH endonuclease family protein [Flavobacterium sp.]|uniref:HNH endonuclease family protein n=1 Tax=Flavobacterium sp. TaxID=239 RepID=UPI003BE34CFE
MKITLKEISVRDLTNGFEDNNDDGVIGYGGMLDIRPPYQREFIYKDKQREAVIDTINKNYPLNVMYWAVNEGGFEVIDGQQRTISICQYVNGDFAYMFRYFHNLQKDEQERILNYKLMIYLCEGNDSEKLEWFRTINIAGEKLTEQELRNAVYSGSWVSDAKRYFSKNGCAAYGLGNNYMNGTPIRQDYLETTIDWISKGNIEVYMSNHQNEANANELWLYFQGVINWVKTIFPKYRKEMKGINWGFLYNEYKDQKFDSKKLEEQIVLLMIDDDITNKKGIYEYVLSGKEKHLNIRAFTDNQKRESYERQKGICVVCKEHFEINEMEADHITPWHEGGKTSSDNCQMLCKYDNRRKSGK